MHGVSGPKARDSSVEAIPLERLKFIPLRLSKHERMLLNVLTNALKVCEYTDAVDVTFSHTRKSKWSRIMESLVDILSISAGLVVANDLPTGEQLISKTMNENVPFFSELFEIGRRYKIMNPSKMLGTFGKLMYILMDTESYQVKSELNINFIKPILTVYNFAKSKQCVDILTDPLWAEASMAISNDFGARARFEIEEMTRRKQRAMIQLLEKYALAVHSKLTREEVQRIVDSIADDEAYITFNVRPVECALELLKTYFDPEKPVLPFSLDLSARGKKPDFRSIFSSFGSGFSPGLLGSGAKLSHSHATQYKFVLQSLTLWREIMRCMLRLWLFADHDMTNESYRLVDTGQGYQRLQSCPRVRNKILTILHRVQSEAGSWVGLSVVHLADRDVPNALIFIDKYTQVPRILAPIVQCIESLPQLAEDAPFHGYVPAEWGSIDALRMQILSDFFKHGYDGSGDDGGSCIDGRLTSAWNWCSQLHKKPYYHVFLFTGFQGFDGDWKDN
jgi:hypothetical protein